jgi:hypothetical protein
LKLDILLPFCGKKTTEGKGFIMKSQEFERRKPDILANTLLSQIPF